jgi:hypothetical protein
MFAATSTLSVDKHMLKQPRQVLLEDQTQIRIIPSVYPSINFFEDLVEASEMETLWEIEGLTNERIRQEVGDLFLVPPEDRVSGQGSSVVMAAFTHIGKASRFTDGSYGVYYASLSLETAVRETVYHRERFLGATQEAACELTMRVYEGTIRKPLHDLKAPDFERYHHPQHYSESQQFGKALREEKSWGIIYRSVRHENGECIAAFRPPAISIPKPMSYLKYLWNGERITEVVNAKSVLIFD